MVSYEKKLKKTQSYFNKNMNVLEIGYGTGMTGVLHAPFVKEYVATDISSQMVDLTRKRAFEASVKNMKFEVNSYNNLSIPDGSMDAVLAMSLLHLVQTPRDLPERAVKECNRCNPRQIRGARSSCDL